ncbi:MAG: hypothetical protein WCG25_05790 [bacterium]
MAVESIISKTRASISVLDKIVQFTSSDFTFLFLNKLFFHLELASGCLEFCFSTSTCICLSNPHPNNNCAISSQISSCDFTALSKTLSYSFFVKIF